MATMPSRSSIKSILFTVQDSAVTESDRTPGTWARHGFMEKRGRPDRVKNPVELLTDESPR
jgi:hypothetical protein